jgi:hypothetical protein
MSDTAREPRKRRRWLRWLIVPLLVASPLLVFWGLADWSSRRELARVREAFAPHAGAAEPAPAPGESPDDDAARRLATIVATIGLGGRDFPRDDPRSKARELARRAARAELDRTSVELAPPEADARDAANLLAPTLAQAREAILAGPPPRWQSMRGTTRWEPDLGAKLTLVDLLLGDAFDRERDGDAATASADMEAAWILVEALREGRSFFGALIARAAAEHVAVAARKVSPLGPEWSARFDIEPIRVDMLADLRLEGSDSLDAARWPDVPRMMADRGGDPPTWARRLGFLMVPTFRKQLARQVEVNIPVIEALEDPSRCGPATLAAVPAKIGGDASWVGWFGEAEAYSSVLSRLDATRVQLELTRRLLDLRARRDADPAHRWPEDLADDGSSSCAGVRFRLVAHGPELLVLEAESQEGPWWEGPESKQRPARVEIRRKVEP